MPAAATLKNQRPRTAAAHASAKRSLARAFETFTNAADSLEKSYGHLQSEVLRLRFDLERSDRDLKISLEENARMRRYLTHIVEELPCGVLVVDRRGEVRIINPQARRLLFMSGINSRNIRENDSDAQDLASRNVDSALDAPPALPQSLRDAVEKLRRGVEPMEQEIKMDSERGARTIGLTCAVLGETSGEDSSTESVFLLRDVTEEKREAAEREAARRRESLAEMATLLAHEIRNPLGSLELFAGLLADAAGAQPDLRRWTDHIQAGLRSLSATVNNVLQFHSQPAPQLSSINLGRLVRESVEFLRPLARQAGLRIDLQNSLGEVEIEADAHRLQQMFFNLSLNAFRAMTSGGMLSVRLRWAAVDRLNEVLVQFEDTGCGIAAEHFDKMFEPGFTTHAGNPGLGLAVCRTVVEQHGGSLMVASEVGKGTVFSLILPRMAARGANA